MHDIDKNLNLAPNIAKLQYLFDCVTFYCFFCLACSPLALHCDERKFLMCVLNPFTILFS